MEPSDPYNFDATGWLDSLLSEYFKEFLPADIDDYYGPCGARCRDGHACKAPKVQCSKRCRMHGGLSTGPRTVQGIQRIREANARRWAEYRRMKAAAKAVERPDLAEPGKGRTDR